ncbi:MAG: DUF4349 domain-containing protein [Deltaproteobacteria bacterium]|nr:DUF4349 domain-containing protein [Deltaproteobacteria bacterium]
MTLKVLACVVLCWLALGCASQRKYASGWDAPSSPAVERAPVPVRAAPTVDVSGPFGLELKADRCIGSMGATIARLRKMVDLARDQRDVVRLNCTLAKLEEVERIERKAGERRSALRGFLLEDDDKAAQELRSVETLERDSARVAAEAQQCAGEELAQAQLENLPAPAARRGAFARNITRLESRVDGIKEQTFRARGRMALLSDTVLSGKAANAGDRGTLGGLTATAKPAAPPTSPNPVANPSARHDPSMLIRTAELTLAVYEVDKNIDAVESAASQVGGYLAMRGDRQIVVRVPRDRFEEALRRIEKLGDVLHRNVAAEDVTDQFVDLEMRLKNAHAVRTRLEALLASASVHDAVEIQKELARVTEEIERFEGKLKLLRDRIAWSTITATFEKLQQQKVRQQALLPFPWMSVIGLSPLLSVPR